MGRGGRSWHASVEEASANATNGRKQFLPLSRSLYQTINKLTPSTKPTFPDDTSWIAVANFANLPDHRYQFLRVGTRPFSYGDP